MLCSSELRSFQQRLGDFESRGIRVAAISVDPPQISREHRKALGVTFPILSDEKGETLGRYDLLHADASPGGGSISRPAEFLVDSTGTVRWSNVTRSVVVRALPDEVLDAHDAIRAGPAGR